jgi:hypothetical protein
MSGAHQYIATLRWQRNGAVFSDRRYSRVHAWTFDGGIEVSFIANSVTTQIEIRPRP